MYCVHICTHVYRTVTASRVVSNRDSWYPQVSPTECTRRLFLDFCESAHEGTAIDVTEKTFFERLYLVLGLRKIALCVSCPCAPEGSQTEIFYFKQK